MNVSTCQVDSLSRYIKDFPRSTRLNPIGKVVENMSWSMIALLGSIILYVGVSVFVKVKQGKNTNKPDSDV